MSNHYQTARAVTVTTTGNIDDLDFSKVGLIRMNNASDATIRGLKAGYDGQRVTIRSIGAGNVFFAHQNTNSAAANRLINFATSASTPIAAGIGIASYVYDATTARWCMSAHDQGNAITPTFAAGDFTADTGTWTVASGDVVSMLYKLVGSFMWVSFFINNTTVATSPNTLRIANGQWGGFTSKNNVRGFGVYSDNGATAVVGTLLRVGASGTQILFDKNDGTTWAAATDNTFILGSFNFPVI